MPKTTYRVVTRGPDGGLRIRDFPTSEPLLETHIQIGVDDCSTDLELRGAPVFRGLVGPMPDGKNIIRYESPDVFESLTKEWMLAKATRRPRRRTMAPEAATSLAVSTAAVSTAAVSTAAVSTAAVTTAAVTPATVEETPTLADATPVS